MLNQYQKNEKCGKKNQKKTNEKIEDEKIEDEKT